MIIGFWDIKLGCHVPLDILLFAIQKVNVFQNHKDHTCKNALLKKLLTNHRFTILRR